MGLFNPRNRTYLTENIGYMQGRTQTRRGALISILRLIQTGKDWPGRGKFGNFPTNKGTRFEPFAESLSGNVFPNLTSIHHRNHHD